MNKAFLYQIPKAEEIKAKIDKWNCRKLQSFCLIKEVIIKVKRKPTEWDNIFINFTCNKGLISRIFKELKQII